MLPFHLQEHPSPEREPCTALSPNHQLTSPSPPLCWNSSLRHPNWHEFDVALSAPPPSFPLLPFLLVNPLFSSLLSHRLCSALKRPGKVHVGDWIAAASQPAPGEMQPLGKKCLAVYCLPVVVMDRRAEAFSEAEPWPPEQTASWLSSSSQQWVAWWRRVSSWSDQSYSLYVPYGGFLYNSIFTVLLSR